MITCFVLIIAFNLQAQDKERKVLFIGIDGVRSDALQLANMPEMDELFDEGLYTYTSWHLGITVSGPSWSSMLTGVWEQKHGVTNNSYTGSNFNEYPYLVTRVREYRPDLKAVQITSWGPFSFDVYNVDWNNDVLLPSDDACLDNAKLQLLDPDLDFLYLHFDDCDAAGHGNQFSPNSPVYMNALEYVDGQVGEVVDALRSRSTYDDEDWLILLTTDHGGIGFGHGGNSLEEKVIWWAAIGSTVTPGEIDIDFNDPQQWFNAPMLTDIAVCAIDHLLPDNDIEDLIAEWDLDGQSWLDPTPVLANKDLSVEKFFSVTPNPATDFVTVQMDEAGQELTYTIYDLTGKVVANRSLAGTKTFDVDMTTFETGIYFITVNRDGVAYTERIILN